MGHGELNQEEGHPYHGSRWCEECNHWHGPLFLCLHFGDNLTDDIKEQQARFRANLRDPKWIQKQLDNGTPPEVIGIFQVLGG